MRRNSNKPMIWDTAISPRVLLETEEPSLDQSPSNHGQTMEGRGSDLGIRYHQCLSLSVWRWPQYYHLTTHTQHGAGRRNNGTSEACGNVVFGCFGQTPQFHLCISEMFLVWLWLLFPPTIVSLSGIRL